MGLVFKVSIGVSDKISAGVIVRAITTLPVRVWAQVSVQVGVSPGLLFKHALAVGVSPGILIKHALELAPASYLFIYY